MKNDLDALLYFILSGATVGGAIGAIGGILVGLVIGSLGGGKGSIWVLVMPFFFWGVGSGVFHGICLGLVCYVLSLVLWKLKNKK